MRTTRQAAKLIGVHRVTLQRWIAAGKIKAPKRVKINGWTLRLWSAKDIQRLGRELKRRK